MKVLKINSSAQNQNSVSRMLVEELIGKLNAKKVIDRDLNDETVPFVSEAMIGAFYTPSDQLNDEQKELLTTSDKYVKELIEADAIVIGLPIYNFSVPGALKAYFDLIARVGITFKYTETGPVGLLENKPTYLVVASGGTVPFTEADFCVNYTKFFLGFLGITNITVVEASQLMMDKDASLAKARKAIEQIS